MTDDVCRATDRDHSAWDRYVRDHDEGTVCHLYAWRHVVASYGMKAHYLLKRDQGHLVGLLPLVEMRGPLASNRLVSMPYLDLGGPLADSPLVLENLLSSAATLVQTLGLSGLDLRFARPRPSGHSGHESPSERTAASLGAPTEALTAPLLGSQASSEAPKRYRFLLDLAGDSEALFKRIGPKVRNQVRKAAKAGLVTESAEASELPLFYQVFARNMRDLGSPVHRLSFFTRLFEELGQQAHLYLTFDEARRVVAGAIELRLGEHSGVPWASSLAEVRASCPNHSLYWTVLETAQAAGCRSFDFGRSSIGTGTFQFKKQWGTEAVPLGWEFRSLRGESEPEAALDPKKHDLLVRTWRRLPLWVATAIGSRLRGQLSQ